MNLRVGQSAQGRGTSPCGATSPSSQVSHPTPLLLETIGIASHPGGKGREGKAAGAGPWTSDGLTDPEPDVDCGNWGWDWKVPARVTCQVGVSQRNPQAPLRKCLRVQESHPKSWGLKRDKILAKADGEQEPVNVSGEGQAWGIFSKGLGAYSVPLGDPAYKTAWPG